MVALVGNTAGAADLIDYLHAYFALDTATALGARERNVGLAATVRIEASCRL